MIVKNESAVIERCLASAKPFIDYWVIVDTGSTDGTQKLISEFMKDVPGELHERPWKNFAYNRNEALQLTKDKGDYVLILDADDYLQYSPDTKLHPLTKDFYLITIHHSSSKYQRVQLVNNKFDWKWKGVLHEYIDCPEARSGDTLFGLNICYTGEGARSKDPEKYKKDAEILELALKEEPDNERYVFYLAQSYKDSGDKKSALKWYKRRAEMGRWDQEVFQSLYIAAMLQEELKMPYEEVVESYKKAYEYRPFRAEPLYRLAAYMRNKGNFFEAYNYAHKALRLPMPADTLFVEEWIYKYGALLELSVDAYWIEKYTEAYLASQLLLSKSDLPEENRRIVIQNMTWIYPKLKQ